MLSALLAINLLIWGVALCYALRLVPALARRWHPAAAAAMIACAVLLSAGSFHYGSRLNVRKQALQYYHAGIDERQRGNLQEAERNFRKALSLQPGNADAKRQLEEVQQQKPVEKREQRRAVRVDTVPSPSGVPAVGPLETSRGTPGEKPKPAPHKPSPFEILHYALDVDIDPAGHTLDGTATIRVRSRGRKVPVLEFSLNPEFKPSSAVVDGSRAEFRHTNDLLAVTPKRALPAGGEASVVIRYARSGGPMVQGGDLIHTTGTYLRSEARWYPATGELDFRAPVRVRARVPKDYTVVSVGALKGVDRDETTARFHWETDRYASMVSLAAAKYVQQSVRSGDLSITCYTFPEHRDRAAAFLKEAASITRYFEKLFGPYPYEKLAVVEIPVFPGGYGTTSFVMLIDKSFEQKKLDREFLAHEIAHQWWGNMVFPQGLGAAWLTEAFANYSAWMYEAAITGNPRVLRKRVARGAARYFDAVERQGDQALHETDPYQPVGAMQEIVYEKGAIVLHTLRKEVGDRVFLRSLRAFADRYRFGKATIQDFQRVVEKESGRELQWFFAQWLGRTGGMEFAYTFDTEPHTASENMAVLMVTQTNPPYRARMEVVLGVEDTIQKQEIEIAKEHETFRIPVKGKVVSVLFDPENWYLMKPPRWVVPEVKR